MLRRRRGALYLHQWVSSPSSKRHCCSIEPTIQYCATSNTRNAFNGLKTRYTCITDKRTYATSTSTTTHATDTKQKRSYYDEMVSQLLEYPALIAAIGLVSGVLAAKYIYANEEAKKTLKYRAEETSRVNPPPATNESHGGGEDKIMHNTKLPSDFINAMQDQFGERFTLAVASREEFSKDPSFHVPYLPDAVVFPQSTEDVQQVVLLCSQYKVPIIPYGHGTSLEGHTSASRGGVTLSFRDMGKILAIHDRDMDAVVQPGITYDELNDALRPYNLFFSVDPGPGASIGGMSATGSSGTNAVRYGTMKENVLSLKVVTADGKIVKTGQRARKSSAGYDLTHLYIGSEGTLGIATEITLRLRNLPEMIGVAVCTFDRITDAADTVIEAMQKGVGIGKVELLDEVMIKALNVGGFKGEEKPTLYFEFSGTSGEVKEQINSMKDISAKHHGGKFKFIQGVESTELWSARKNALWYAPALRPGSEVMITDVCVPISQLALCIDETKRDISTSSLLAPLVGHVGDGNFHLFILLNPNDTNDVQEAARLNHRLVERAIRLEGTCTGEHGIGIGKKEYLPLELGQEAVDVMKNIKTALDPEGILNPGKVIDVKSVNRDH